MVRKVIRGHGLGPAMIVVRVYQKDRRSDVCLLRMSRNVARRDLLKDQMSVVSGSVQQQS